jgi:hypothetical protein
MYNSLKKDYEIRTFDVIMSPNPQSKIKETKKFINKLTSDKKCSLEHIILCR